MSATTPPVRRFTPGGESGPVRFGDRRIVVTPAVDAAEGGPLSTYSAFFGAGESADLPAPYDEVWVVIRGRIVVGETGARSARQPGTTSTCPGTARARSRRSRTPS